MTKEIPHRQSEEYDAEHARFCEMLTGALERMMIREIKGGRMPPGNDLIFVDALLLVAGEFLAGYYQAKGKDFADLANRIAYFRGAAEDMFLRPAAEKATEAKAPKGGLQ